MDLNRKVDHESYTATDMPLYPARVLTAHCLMKGLQAGSVLGLFAITPAHKFLKKEALTTSWRRMMPGSVIAGTTISMGLLAFKGYQGQLDIAGVDDRAYRISKSEGQVKVDRYSMIGGFIGASLGAVLGRFSGGNIVAGSSTGIALGVVFYMTEKLKLLDQFK